MGLVGLLFASNSMGFHCWCGAPSKPQEPLSGMFVTSVISSSPSISILRFSFIKSRVKCIFRTQTDNVRTTWLLTLQPDNWMQARNDVLSVAINALCDNSTKMVQKAVAVDQ